MPTARRRGRRHARGGAGAEDVEPHAAVEQPDHFVGLEVHVRVRVEVQRAAVVEEDLDAAVLRADAIAGEQRHRRGRGFRPSVTLEERGAVDDRDVSRRVGRGILGARGTRGRSHRRPQERMQRRRARRGIGTSGSESTRRDAGRALSPPRRRGLARPSIAPTYGESIGHDIDINALRLYIIERYKA